MALHIRDAKVDRLVREFAAIRGVGLTEAVEIAMTEALENVSIRDKVRAIQQRLAAIPDSGLKADKAFYDSLNDDDVLDEE